MGQWYFNKYKPGDKHRDPIQGEFFSSEAISDPGRALVREGIQNSLDAANDDKPVIVRIFISDDKHINNRNVINEFLAGSWDHFHATNNGLREVPDEYEHCRFLVFEDFNTTGLAGDPYELEPQHGSKNHFFYFFRTEGISGKGEGDRGRWGVGKTVFQRSSRINTMFGLTIVQDNSQPLLMGVSILKSHRVNGNSYTPDGWFGTVQNDIVMPIVDNKFHERFKKAFHLDRGMEPGLSIVVPWLDAEVSSNAIIEAVLKDYFYPVLTGKLEVIVEAPENKITVDKNSIDTELKKVGGKFEHEIRPLIDLSRWSLAQDAGHRLCQGPRWLLD